MSEANKPEFDIAFMGAGIALFIKAPT